MKRASGILLFRKSGAEVEVLLVHSSGAYNRKAPWGIPKGGPDPGEPPEDTARRETKEETGIAVTGPLVPLGSIRYQKSRKEVTCFAREAPEAAEPRCASWEIDAARFMSLDEARNRIHPDQRPFLDRLVDHLGQL